MKPLDILPTYPTLETMNAIAEEVLEARRKFPTNEHRLAALTEEVGELAKALLEGKRFPECRKEAMQVAAMAIRFMEEGDADFWQSFIDRNRHSDSRQYLPVFEAHRTASPESP